MNIIRKILSVPFWILLSVSFVGYIMSKKALAGLKQRNIDCTMLDLLQEKDKNKWIVLNEKEKVIQRSKISTTPSL